MNNNINRGNDSKNKIDSVLVKGWESGYRIPVAHCKYQQPVTGNQQLFYFLV